AERAVERGTALRTDQRNEVINQAEIRYPIAMQTKDRAQRAVNPMRPAGRHPVAEDTQVSFIAPPPPDHPQVRVIQFVRQEAERLFGMEVGEIEAVGRGAIRSYKQRQKMLHDLDGQVADALLFGCAERRGAVTHGFRELATPQTDVRAVVGQTDVR